MLTALRVILLALFIAAPIGKQDNGADLERPAADSADGSATVPGTFRVRLGGSRWTVTTKPASAGEGAHIRTSSHAPDVPRGKGVEADADVLAWLPPVLALGSKPVPPVSAAEDACAVPGGLKEIG